ncbi:uncharacterized protein LOC111391632 [Olea europaea var. sylvestris]|uniref:uncharacterized protein LOC111391632 n=1 Tax=Olea europaea var. sylvestris TaxID=158386 RepID=UPI000C1CF7D7|nr:uncharacterized protein LOC111391632 [Olea europaea var. sylvestris]
MKHFSHPHGLEQSEVQKEEEMICSGCEQELSGLAYICKKRNCDFFLHESCFKLPPNIQHKFHSDHPLDLKSGPPEYSLYYPCDACGDSINAFVYQCQKCDFKIHVTCAFLPDTEICKSHTHPLNLLHSTPNSSEDDLIYTCDVCDGTLSEGYWCYYCPDCDFGTHLECIKSSDLSKEEDDQEEEEEEESDEEESDQVKLIRTRIKAENQMARLEFQMKMAKLNAESMASISRTYF